LSRSTSKYGNNRVAAGTASTTPTSAAAGAARLRMPGMPAMDARKQTKARLRNGILFIADLLRKG
jgi:hypothetical protein